MIGCWVMTATVLVGEEEALLLALCHGCCCCYRPFYDWTQHTLGDTGWSIASNFVYWIMSLMKDALNTVSFTAGSYYYIIRCSSGGALERSRVFSTVSRMWGPSLHSSTTFTVNMAEIWNTLPLGRHYLSFFVGTPQRQSNRHSDLGNQGFQNKKWRYWKPPFWSPTSRRFNAVTVYGIIPFCQTL